MSTLEMLKSELNGIDIRFDEPFYSEQGLMAEADETEGLIKRASDLY